MCCCVCVRPGVFTEYTCAHARRASTQQDGTAAVAAQPSSSCLSRNEERSNRLPWRKDVFIQRRLAGSERRKTDYRSTLVKRQHSGAQVAKRHIKRCSRSADRQLALSESAKNKQALEFTNRGISSVLTPTQPRWRIPFSCPGAL